MFWSGNYIGVRELKNLLKEENVTLTQVLEADDILQECKGDNKALLQFLTRPDILAELITLITEEPPKDVELTMQYRHASIACEVLTSHLSMLTDRLSLDTTQMNRLCDFINRDPPLNPILASYFCKTVEMLLERSPKQDWYLYHIVCLRVLDFFKSRRDFLPNLLRHLATSAIADTFKCFIRLDDLFNKIVMEWLDEHQFLECLIQIICGTYEPTTGTGSGCSSPPEQPPAAAPPPPAPTAPLTDTDQPEKAEQELSEKPQLNQNHKDGGEGTKENEQGCTDSEPDVDMSRCIINKSDCDLESDCESVMSRRLRVAAAANATALLEDLILNGFADEGCSPRGRMVWTLVWRLQQPSWVRSLLCAVFTSPPSHAARALHHGCRLLLALLCAEPVPLPAVGGAGGGSGGSTGNTGGSGGSDHHSVCVWMAPHLPLLHQALLKDPNAQTHVTQCVGVGGGVGGTGGGAGGGVGWARVSAAALLAELALSEAPDVPKTLLTLGTPGAMVELMFRYPDNNFLHAHVYSMVKNALANPTYRKMYAEHLFVECDLLTRLMDVFEENENKKEGVPRAGYMGHVVLLLRTCCAHLLYDGEGGAGGGGSEAGGGGGACSLPDAVHARLLHFRDNVLQTLIYYLDVPLGGCYPSDNTYEVENVGDTLEGTYDYDTAAGNLDEDIVFSVGNEMGVGGFEGGGAQQADSDAQRQSAEQSFLELASRKFGDDMWEDCPEGEKADNDGDLDHADWLMTPSAMDHITTGVQRLLDANFSLWDSEDNGGVDNGDGDDSGGGGWARFEMADAHQPVDPFAVPTPTPPPTPPKASSCDAEARLDLDERLGNLKMVDSTDNGNSITQSDDASVWGLDSSNNASDSPSKVFDSPSKLSDSPSKLSDSPSKLSDSTSKLPDSPSKLSDSPSKLSDSPSKLIDNSDKLQLDATVSSSKQCDSPTKLFDSSDKQFDSSYKVSDGNDKLLDRSDKSDSIDKQSDSSDKVSESSDKQSDSSDKQSDSSDKQSDSPIDTGFTDTMCDNSNPSSDS